jgi:phosphatidylglycerophosphate synthase
MRDKIFNPFSRFFTFCRLSPDTLSLIGLAAMVFLIVLYPKYSIALLAVSILADMLDGPLARYQKIDSERGRVFDIACDTASFALFALAMGSFGAMSFYAASLLASSFALSMIACTRHAIFEAKRKNLPFKHAKGSWTIPSVIKGIFYGLFILFIFIGSDMVFPDMAIVVLCSSLIAFSLSRKGLFA